MQMLRAQNSRLQLLRRRLDALAQKRVMTDPGAFIQDKQMLLGHLQKDLYHAASERLRAPGNRLASLAAALDAMSPLKVLGRGFSLVENSTGEIVRSCTDVAVGEKVTVRLSDGQLRCCVDECLNNENGGEV